MPFASVELVLPLESLLILLRLAWRVFSCVCMEGLRSFCAGKNEQNSKIARLAASNFEIKNHHRAAGQLHEAVLLLLHLSRRIHNDTFK